MNLFLQRNWAWLALKGVIFSVFGIIALLATEIALVTMVWYLGLVTLIGGVLLGGGAFVVRKRTGGLSSVLALEAIVDIAIGALILAYPGFTVKVVVYVLGFWALVIGIIQILTALNLRRKGEAFVVNLINGVLAGVFGGVLLANPFEGALALTLIIGIFAIAFGIFMLVAAVRLKRKQPQALDEV